jgi:hypothetical protein
VLTIHAELEGMKHIALFRAFLERIKKQAIQLIKLEDFARDLTKKPSAIPVCDLVAGTIEGRSGALAVQKCSVRSS